MPSGSGYAGAGAQQERAAVTIRAAGGAAGAVLPLTWVRGEPKAEAAITTAATTAAAAGAGGQGGEGGEGARDPSPGTGTSAAVHVLTGGGRTATSPFSSTGLLYIPAHLACLAHKR